MFSIAYRMLGTVSDADDIIQETFLRWQKLDASKVNSAQAFLSTAVTRLCIDFLRSTKRQREQYIGPWLPEPLVADSSHQDRNAEFADSLSLAFLAMLEKLSPTERAVLLLHDVFGFEFKEVARMIGKTPVNCRQICRRARKYVRKPEAKFQPEPEQAEQLAEKFIAACQSGNIDELVSLMADDIILYSDGGGKVAAARRPLEGFQEVSRFLVGIAQRAPSDLQVFPLLVNGRSGLAIQQGNQIQRVFSLDFENSKLKTICVVGNPNKLRHLQPNL